MSTQTEEPSQTLELVPEGEPIPTKQLAPYHEFQTKIESLKKTAETITVTDISQTAEMKIARTTRLSLKEIRVAITHRHKELKENILVEGRKIDAGKNELLALLEPLETRLLDQEQFAERKAAEDLAARIKRRAERLLPFWNAAYPMPDLGALTVDQFDTLLADSETAATAKLEAAKKSEADRIAKEKADEAERERQRLEVIRLRKEAEEREAQAKKERESAAAEKARLDKQLADERKAAEAKAAKIKSDAEAAAAKERERVAKEQEAERQRVAHEKRTAEVKAQKEREEIESKARADKAAAEKENARLAGIAEVERQKAATAAREAKEAREKIEREAQAARDAKVKEEAAKLAAAAKAKRAPDRDKLLALAKALNAVPFPEMATPEGNTLMADINDSFDALITLIQTRAQSL